jgi:hypothetical protein
LNNSEEEQSFDEEDEALPEEHKEDRVFSKYGEKSSAMPIKARQTKQGNHNLNVV